VDVSDECVPKLDNVAGEVEDRGGEGGERITAEGGVPGLDTAKDDGFDEVAMTRNVVRSNKMTSVALHAVANLSRWRVSTETFGIRVCTICDQA
jgi:hypothetical protein